MSEQSAFVFHDPDNVTFKVSRDEVSDLRLLNVASGDTYVLCQDGTVINGGDNQTASLDQTLLLLQCRKAYVASWPDGAARQYELDLTIRLLQGLKT